MKNFLTPLLLLCLVATSLPLSAQFKRERSTANKEYELKAFHLAVESYKKALERRPSDLESLSKLADSYRMLNQMQKAHTTYQQAVRDKKVSGETVLQHAHVLKAIGSYDEAKQWYLLYARDHDMVIGNHYAQSADFAKAQAKRDAGFTAQSINVNSPVSDFGAAMPSAQQLVFSSSRTAAGEAFDGQAKNVPYVTAVAPDGGMKQAFSLQTGYNDPSGNVGPVSYTPDGRQVIFTRNNFVASTRMVPEAGITMTLLIAEVNDQGAWVNPRPLPFNGTDYNCGYGTFSSDGNTIYFSSDRPEGYGGYDIYRVRRQGQTWEAVPENLGTVVNSIGHELTPYFDGQSLFFSSDWHHGLGSYDVFRAEVTNGRPTNLFHMGAGINSSRDDLGFVYDPITATGYVTSNRIGGSGMEDIYRVGRKADNKTLVVQSAKDGSYLANVAVDFSACGGQVYTTDAQGRYVFEATEGLSCDITISKAGFQPVRMPITSMQVQSDNTVRVALEMLGSSTGVGPGVTGTISRPNTSVNVPGGPTPPGTYRGMVVNAQTKYPIPMANVRVTQRNTGNSAIARTNVDGAYIMALTPGVTYDIEISSEGFETVRYPVTNVDGSNPNILGIMDLLPSQTASTTTTSTNPVVTNPTTTTTTTTTPTTTTTTTAPTTTSGYSVQLASLRARPDLSKYSNVNNLGQVYQTNTGSAYKVRLGVFASRAEAEVAAKRAQIAGYQGAFVVSDSGPSAGSMTTSTPSAAAPATASAGGSRYKVQIGAYSKPGNFDRAKASSLGTIEAATRGSLTLFMVGGLNSQTDAEAVKARARSMGYSGAFILEMVNGKLVKLGQ